MARRGLLIVIGLVGCGESGSSSSPSFPTNYRSSYVQVRPCRPSGDHDLNNVAILADPRALDAYSQRDRAFPEGAVVIKEEFEFTDDTCQGQVVGWTVMMRLADGSSPATLDWQWQRVDADRNVISEDEPRCYGCHRSCGNPPDGYAGTCSIP